MNKISAALTAFLVALQLGCESTTKPTTLPPSISCPSAVTEQSLNGAPVTVTYAPPTASGGEAPLTTSCTPSSGSSFNVGTTIVACTVLDALHRTASCTFPVTVLKVPQLSETKYVAFGDSITQGQIDTPCPGQVGATLQEALKSLRGLERIVDPARSYPTKLLTLLTGRYPGQGITMFNAGLGGETVEQGQARLPGVLTAQKPQVLLLQEGANDLTGIAFGSPPYTVMSTIVNGLRAMIREARRRGILVFVGTLLPQRAGSCRAYAPEYIAPTNDLIRVMVAGEGPGVTLVDLYAAFGGVAGDLLSPDGLHPNDAGYQRMAQDFFENIQQLETMARPPITVGETGGQVVPPVRRTGR